MAQEQDIWQLDEYTIVWGQSSPDGRILARQVAGLGARFLAAMVDFALQSAFAAAVGLFVYLKHPHLVAPHERAWFFTAAVLEWHILYFLLFEAFTWGRTPGKALLGIAVVDLRTGDRAKWFQLLGRNLTRALDILPIHYLAGAISIASSSKRQRLGDRLCSTIVVYVRSFVEQLEAAGVPASNYSTSEDGYLLQAFVRRASSLHPNVRPFLAREVARYFHRKYPNEDAALTRLYDEELYAAYLERRCDQESEAAKLAD